MAGRRTPVLEVPQRVLELPAVREFERIVAASGEIPPERARVVTRLVVLRVLSAIAERYARAVARDVDAVLGLREQLTSLYRRSLAATRGEGATPIEVGAYGRLVESLVGHIDDIAEAHEWFARRGPEEVTGPEPDYAGLWEESLTASTDGEPAPGGAPPDEPYRPPDEPPTAHFDDPPQPHPVRGSRTSAETAYNRDLSRILRRLDPAQGNLSQQRSLVVEFKNLIHERYLRAGGVPDVGVARQPSSGAHLSAEIALGDLDPVRDLGYEIWLELPPDLQAGGQRIVRPDGWSFTGDRFEWLEWKHPESQAQAAGHYAGAAGQLQLLADLELRGRLAERIPACDGWRYGSNAGWLADTLGWALRTLQGRDAGAPPAAATDAFVAAVNQMAATRPTWASKFRVAPDGQ